MHSTVRLSFLICCLLAPTAHAQTQPAPYDISPVIRRLSEPGTGGYNAAMNQAKALPTSAIFPIWDYLADESHPLEIREDLATALEAIYARERVPRNARDARDLAHWRQTTGMDIYKKSNPDPRWDAIAQKGLLEADANNPAAVDTLKAALDAGCKDVLVRYIYVFHALTNKRISLPDAIHMLDQIAADSDKSPYPAGRRFFANLTFAFQAGKPGCPPDVSSDRKFTALRTAINLFPDLVREHPGRAVLKDAVSYLYPTAASLHQSSRNQQGYAEIVDTIRKALPDDPIVYSLESQFFLDATWESMTLRPSDQSYEEQMKVISDNAQAVMVAAEKGWKADPLEPDCPMAAVAVCWMSGLDQRTMETWFSRAACADPHNLRLCTWKASYLIDHASAAEALDFGRFCLKNGTAKDRLPGVLIYIHEMHRSISGNVPEYLAQPYVWTDIKAAYDKLLSDKSLLQTNRATYLADRAKYVKWACECRQWKAAAALMQDYGNDIDINALGGKALYDYFRGKAQRESAKTP